MNKFKTLLNAFDTVLQKHNPVAYRGLLPPLTDEEIDVYLANFSIEDEDLRLLYQWKAGTRMPMDGQMTDYGGLLTFDFLNKLLSRKFYYDPLLLPLISENGEEMLLFNSKPGQHYGKIYLYSVPQLYIEHPVSYFDSLQSMIQTITAAYEQGAYIFDSRENWLDTDYDKFHKIAITLNKSSVFWTEHDEVMWEEWYEI